MKKLLFMGVVAFAACSPTNSTTMQVTMLTSVKEVTGNQTRLTEYTYDTQGATKRIYQTLNGVPVYETADYAWEAGSKVVYYRTDYQGMGATRYKVTTTYGASYNNVMLVTAEEVRRVSDDVVMSLEKTTYDAQGRPSLIVRTEEETEVLRMENYNYTTVTATGGYYTYDEKTSGGEAVKMALMRTKFDTYGELIGYQIYSGWESTDKPGTLVEEKKNYGASGLEISYTIFKDGAETKVLRVYEQIKVTY